MENYGHFTENGYRITKRNTPRHWYNYLFNEEYITFLSQVGFGRGFAQDAPGRRFDLVTDRNLYIVQDSAFWSAMGLPVYEAVQEYSCLHAIGYTEISLKKNDILTKIRVFVPTVGKKENWAVTITNQSKEIKTLKLIPYCATEADCDRAEFANEKNAVIAADYKAFGSDEIALQYAYLASGDTVTGFDTRHSAFIGAYGNKQQPRAILENHGCTNSECIAEKACLALENTVTLSPGESKTIYYTIGVESSPESIISFSNAEIEYQFEEMQQKYSQELGLVTVQTPWKDLNCLFNDWLKYQTNMGSQWASVKHTGLRELTGDVECLSSVNAPLAANKLCRILRYQSGDGQSPRTVSDGKTQDKFCADNAVWLVFAAHAVIKESGNIDFLTHVVSFNDGSCGSIYEHIKRAVSFLWNSTGYGGLIKIGGGDSGDCMNNAGVKGKGVSVWLSIAFIRAVKLFAQMANWMGNETDSRTAAHYAQEMEERVNRFGWDEDRYLYAISDDQYPIGSKVNSEGSLFAAPQLWSVLADLDKKYTNIAMETLEKELNTDLGLLFSKPPYTKPCPSIGSITCKYPGLDENGGIDLCTSMWKLIVDCILHRPDKVEEGLEKILPGHQKYAQTCGEPYVLFDSYLGEQTGYRAGKPGQSWRTASRPWLMYALVRFIYGFQPEFGGVLLKPCLPPGWRECTLKKIFRDCQYNIHYIQEGQHPQSEIQSISVNGTEVPTNLPIRPLKGKTLTVKVLLK